MRALLSTCLVIVLVLLGGLAYANFAWLPTYGKPRLERLLSERTHLTVTIDRLSYRFPSGLVADNMRMSDPARRIPSLIWSFVHAHIAPWPLLRERRVNFLVVAQLQAPVATSGQIRGSYAWDAQSLSARVRVPRFDLAALHSAGLGRERAEIRRAMLTGEAELMWVPEQPLRITYHAHLASVDARLQALAIEAQGELDLDGNATYDTAHRRWVDDAGTFTIAHGQALGPGLAMISDVTATGRVTHEQLTDLRVRGQWLGAYPADITGRIDSWAHPTADLTLTADIALDDRLYARLPSLPALAHPQGHLAIVATWQGPVQQSEAWPAWPVTAIVTLDHGELSIPGLAQPLRTIAGTLRYAAETVTVDPLTFTHAGVPYSGTAHITALSQEPHVVAQLQRPDVHCRLEAAVAEDRVSLTRCDATFHASRLTLMGDITRSPTPTLNLYAEGVLALADAARWPTIAQVMRDWPFSGTVPFTLFLAGPLRNFAALEGGLKLSPTTVQLRETPVRVQRAAVQWRAGRITLEALDADVATGSLSAQGEASLPLASGPCRGRLVLDRVDIAPMARSFWPESARPATGLLTARSEIDGARCEGSALHGTGAFHLSEGRLGSVPLFDKVLWGLLGNLADRLGYAELRRAEITQASGRWSLVDGKMQTDDTVVIAQYAGSAIPIQLRGWIGLDQQVDLLVEPRLPPDLLQQAPNIPQAIRELARAAVTVSDLKQLVGRQRITGTLQQPVSRFEFSFDELLRQLPFQGLQQLLFPTKPARGE